MDKNNFKCKYCKKKINKFDYDLQNGYCRKSKDIMEWKQTLNYIKEYKR